MCFWFDLFSRTPTESIIILKLWFHFICCGSFSLDPWETICMILSWLAKLRSHIMTYTQMGYSWKENRNNHIVWICVKYLSTWKSSNDLFEIGNCSSNCFGIITWCNWHSLILNILRNTSLWFKMVLRLTASIYTCNTNQSILLSKSIRVWQRCPVLPLTTETRIFIVVLTL
jgi:hypothetical protein